MKDFLRKAKKYGEEALDILKESQSQIIKKHIVQDNETLSDIALKYYGKATEPYWKLIHTFNRATIGSDANKIRKGMELNIPKLPNNLK